MRTVTVNTFVTLDGVMQAPGGPEDNLIQTLLSANLVDFFRLWVFPVVAGKGKRLFGAGTRAAGLTLVESRASTTGVVISSYRPAGALQPGSFELVTPTPAEMERRRKMAEVG